MAIIIAKTNQSNVTRTHMVGIMSIAACASLGESDHVLRAQQDM
ncbi:hypothetical protein ACOI1H_14685 [Loktanella sp. DJP18]